MLLNRDFSDIFAELNAVGARYLLVGGYAVGVHGIPRFTKDLDLWVEPTHTNATRVHAALLSFGAPLDNVTVEDFKNAWAARIVAHYGRQRIYVIGRRHLIQNKQASGRPQDLADVTMLRKVK